jgi:cell division transport system permease protein
MRKARRTGRPATERRQRARSARWRPGGGFHPANWLVRHLQVMLSTLGRLTRSPAGTLMTAGVIGIAIALPAGLHLLVKNVQAVSGPLDGGASISLFVRTEVADQAALALAERLRQRAEVAEVEFLAREQALAEFREFSGFGEALDLLDENPLPAVLLIRPAATHSTPAAAQALAEALAKQPEVELAQLDLQWLRRLHAFTQAAQRGIAVLGVLLALAVVLIVGNTIRLEIQNRHDEIAVTRLVGATNAFIRRPFLYTGFWYGLFGGLLAWMVILGGVALLRGPVQRLAGLYHADFALAAYSPGLLLMLLAGGPLLGWLGAWSVVNRHLAQTRPA